MSKTLSWSPASHDSDKVGASLLFQDTDVFWRQKDGDFKAILSYITSWRPGKEARRGKIRGAGR